MLMILQCLPSVWRLRRNNSQAYSFSSCQIFPANLFVLAMQARSSRRSRDPSPQVSVQSTTDAAEQEDAASSIVTLDDSIFLLHRWTAGVRTQNAEENGMLYQASPGVNSVQ